MFEEIRLNKNYAVLYTSELPEGSVRDEGWHNLKRVENRVIIPTDQMLNEIKRKFKDRSFLYEGILPMNCRYAFEDVNGTSLFVIEEHPSVRTMKIAFSMSRYIQDARERGVEKEWGEIYEYVVEQDKEGRDLMLNLAFPFILHFITCTRDFRYTGSHVYFKPSPLVGFGDFLCKPLLPNINTNHSICMGDGMGGQRYNNITQMVQHYMHYFWNNAYNRDYFYFPNEYFREKIPYVSNFIEWAYRTKNDPSFVFKTRWIPARPKIFGTIVKSVMRRHSVQYTDPTLPAGHPRAVDEATPTISKLTHIFTKSIPSQEMTDDDPPQPMKDNSSSSIDLLVDGRMLLFVGDIFKHNGEEVEVVSFLSSSKKATTTHMRLKFPDGSTEIRRLTRAIKDEAIAYIKEKHEKCEIVIDGVKYKIGDIVKVKTKGMSKVTFRKIDDLRTFEGVDEINLSGHYYIAKNISLEKYDISNAKLGDIKLSRGKEIVFVDERMNTGIITFRHLTFIGFDITPQGKLLFNFSNKDTRVHDIINPDDHRHYTVLDLSKMNKTQDPIRIADEYYEILPRKKDDYLYYDKSGVYMNQYSNFKNSDFDDIVKKWYDGESIKIPGYDFDISYRVGDMVVCSDWTDPLEMLKIRQIVGFKVDHTNAKISAVLQDKHKNVTEHVIINGEHSKIEAMTLRKVINQYKNISIGMKLRAKVEGITGFPKEDTNIVVAIIDDMDLKEPMVLCSNGLTLWVSDVISNFRKIKMGTASWNKYDHVDLDTSKIELQEGDMFEIKDGPFSKECRYHIFMKDNKLMCDILEDRHPPRNILFDKLYKAYSLPYGFLPPRWSHESNNNDSDVEATEIEMIRGTLSLNLMIRPNEASKCYYPKDTRRLIDV